MALRPWMLTPSTPLICVSVMVSAAAASERVDAAERRERIIEREREDAVLQRQGHTFQSLRERAIAASQRQNAR